MKIDSLLTTADKQTDFALWYADISKLEQLLELPPGFVDGLLNEDDWSYVVKTHALLEAALTHMLIDANDPRLADVFRKLQLGGGRTGKIAFAKALEVADPASLKLISQISELRNSLVHDVRQFSFKLVPYVQSLPPNESRQFARLIADVIGLPQDSETTATSVGLFREHPKEALSPSVIHLG